MRNSLSINECMTEFRTEKSPRDLLLHVAVAAAVVGVAAAAAFLTFASGA